MRRFAVLLMSSTLWVGCSVRVDDTSEARDEQAEATQVLAMDALAQDTFSLPAEQRAEDLAAFLRQFVARHAPELAFSREPVAKRNDDQIITEAFEVYHVAGGTTFYVELSLLAFGYVDVRFSQSEGMPLHETTSEQVDVSWGPYANGLPHLGKTAKAYWLLF